MAVRTTDVAIAARTRKSRVSPALCGSLAVVLLLADLLPPRASFAQGASFSAATNFAAGDGPETVVMGDFNGDGALDLAVANTHGSDVSILLGTGTGSFAAATNFATLGLTPRDIAVGDFNGDGTQDLAVANGGSSDVSILLGTGTGSFGAAAKFTVGSGPRSVAVGDFDGDGTLDLAVANGGSNSVSILLGTGTGSFGAATNFAAGSFPVSVAVGDFNGDGKQDLAVANFSDANVSILLGTGTGGFGSATNFAVGLQPAKIVIADFKGDSKLDLAVANAGSHNVSILLGTGAGSFGVATNFTVGSTPLSLTAGNFNGDGNLDLAVANAGSGGVSGPVSILLGDGTGTFETGGSFSVGFSPQSVAAGDLNDDGKQDLATANSGSDDISILLNTGTAVTPDLAPPVISDLTATPSILWPPDHRMVPVAVSVDVSDDVDEAPVCAVVSVASNEPVVGGGSGMTLPDWKIVGPLAIELRAERAGTGNGRAYTVGIECTDASGKSSAATATVAVPHDQRKR